MELNPAEVHVPWLLGDKAPKEMTLVVPPLTFTGHAYGGQRVMTPKPRCLQYKGHHQPGLPQWKKKKVSTFSVVVLLTHFSCQCYTKAHFALSVSVSPS